MRYTDDYIKKVLNNADIVKVIGQYTKLEKQGDIYLGKCVFHNGNEKTLTVYPDKKVFHCFSCGEGGNAAVFLMKHLKISMDEAIKQIADKSGIQPTKNDYKEPENLVKKKILYSINKDAAIFYMHKLKEQGGETAMTYLKERQLTDKDIKDFALGYSPAKGNALYKYLLKKNYTLEQMKEAGLVKVSENGPYDMFRGRLMFPIIDPQGRVIAFGGRTLDPEGKPKYLNSPETIIFNKSQTLYGMNNVPKKRLNYLILCEGYMDVIRLQSSGFRNAAAPLGTAFTRTHIPLVKQYANNLILSYDSDDAGIKAAMRTIKATQETDMGIRVLSLSPEKDPDDFLKHWGVEEFKTRIQRSTEKINFELQVMSKKYDLTNPEQKEEFFKAAVAQLAKENNVINREDVER